MTDEHYDVWLVWLKRSDEEGVPTMLSGAYTSEDRAKAAVAASEIEEGEFEIFGDILDDTAWIGGFFGGGEE